MARNRTPPPQGLFPPPPAAASIPSDLLGAAASATAIAPAPPPPPIVEIPEGNTQGRPVPMGVVPADADAASPAVAKPDRAPSSPRPHLLFGWPEGCPTHRAGGEGGAPNAFNISRSQWRTHWAFFLILNEISA